MLLRNISTELYHVLIMLTRGRAQRFVLKPIEQEELEAYRFLLRRYEPVSTVTAVSKLLGLLATTFEWRSCGLFHRPREVSRILEHDAQETLSDLIKIGVIIKGIGSRMNERSCAVHSSKPAW